MPLIVPTLDNRLYQDFVDEARARIPVHTPEWTNHNASDPGITLLQLFAFMSEHLAYRANFIPERNRLKFLSLLGVPLHPGSAARGIVQFDNERGPLQTITLNNDLEVRAGQVPFRTEMGLDVLPIEAQVYYKYESVGQSEAALEYYRQLYASYLDSDQTMSPQVYETRLMSPRGTTAVDLAADTIDNSLWIALLMRAGDKPYATLKDDVRRAIAGKTISLGVVPQAADIGRRLAPGQQPADDVRLQYRLPSVPANGLLPTGANRTPAYVPLPAAPAPDILTEPGIVQIALPGDTELRLWENLDPLEAGVGDFPPALEDTVLNERIITWLRITAPPGARVSLLWLGINSTMVTQRTHVTNEQLPNGTGEPDQVVSLSQPPVISHSVRLTVTPPAGPSEKWEEIGDLMNAGPEVPVPDLRNPPGAPPALPLPVKVFAVDAEAGQIRAGDGAHGARFPRGAVLRVDYDSTVGAEGNVGPGSINSSPALPAGLRVANPVFTWGGSEPESVSDGEKQITRFLQHHDRLVNADDFAAITLRTPGVDIGRVEVLPAFNPALGANEPGGAPGAVTLMVIPKNDPAWPNAPQPGRLFLDAICRHLDLRRLVTTELFLRGPVYQDLWVSVGITVMGRASIAQVSEMVKQELQRFLSPLPTVPDTALEPVPMLTTPEYRDTGQGWPLRKSVLRLELLAIANRVAGVVLVNDLILVDAAGAVREDIPMRGLELPRVRGISVVSGQPLPADQLPGRSATSAPTAQPVVPVPIIPDSCGPSV